MTRRELELALARIERIARDARDGRGDRARAFEAIAAAAAVCEEEPGAAVERLKARERVLLARSSLLHRVIEATRVEARRQRADHALKLVDADLQRVDLATFIARGRVDDGYRVALREGRATERRWTARLTRDTGRRNGSIRVETASDGRRTVTISGTYVNVGDQSARALYDANELAHSSAALAEIGGTYELRPNVARGGQDESVSFVFTHVFVELVPVRE